jgi:hypothetical protein
MFRSIALILTIPTMASAVQTYDADVAVYSATAGGAVASVAAARQGAKVVLIEPGRHVGGMFSGGLSHSDVYGQENLIGGVVEEVFRRIAAHYGKEGAKAGFKFEPHVAENTLKAMLDEAGVQVVYGERLDSVTKNGPRIVSLKTESGNTYAAKVFIDAGYEGDLMAKAGVKYTVGREGRETYDEWLAGRTELLPSQHQFVYPVSPWKDGKYLPFITPQAKLTATGKGDGKFQAYCFRLCLTDRIENRIPIEKPENYNPDDYELLRRYLKAAGDQAFPGVIHLTPLPNGKRDANSSGGVSTDLMGPNWEYPEAGYARREEIWRQYLRWAHGFLWFLQNDPSVPAQQRQDLRRWGLCKDEFTDTGGWPHQLYIREGRRMLGEVVVTQHDLETQRTKPDSVGMCGYNIDIREVQWVAVRTYRFPKAEDRVLTEGYISQPVKPWQIPYRALTPKAEECDNLLVSACSSMSTVAFGGFRLEPGYMIAGQAAGTAAALAAQSKSAVQKIDYEQLRRLLEKRGQVLELPE